MDLSDHYNTYCTYKDAYLQHKKQYMERKDLCDRNLHKCCNTLSSIFWDNIYLKSDFKMRQSSLLDNIYTNYNISTDNCSSGIICSDFSDHYYTIDE